MKKSYLDEIITALKDFNDDCADKKDEMIEIDDGDRADIYFNRCKELHNMVNFMIELKKLAELGGKDDIMKLLNKKWRAR